MRVAICFNHPSKKRHVSDGRPPINVLMERLQPFVHSKIGYTTALEMYLTQKSRS
jgi:hypothetical protein